MLLISAELRMTPPTVLTPKSRVKKYTDLLGMTAIGLADSYLTLLRI